MLTELKHGYSMLTCVAPQHPPLSADFWTESLQFFFLIRSFLYTLQPLASLTPFPSASAEKIGRKGLPPAAMILMVDEIASCCACLERSVTYVTRLCMPIFPRRTVVRNGYCKETEYNWEHVYIFAQLIIQATHVGVSPKKCQQQPTPHLLSSASIILFLSIILLLLLQAVPLPVAL